MEGKQVLWGVPDWVFSCVSDIFISFMLWTRQKCHFRLMGGPGRNCPAGRLAQHSLCNHLLKTSYMSGTMLGSLCTLIGLSLCLQGSLTLVGETEKLPHLCNRKMWKEECGLGGQEPWVYFNLCFGSCMIFIWLLLLSGVQFPAPELQLFWWTLFPSTLALGILKLCINVVQEPKEELRLLNSGRADICIGA